MFSVAINLANTSADAKNFWANINWAQPSWDVFIILFFVVGAILYGFSLGRDRVIVILISIYMALAVVNTMPFIGDLVKNTPLDQFSIFRMSSFVVVFMVLFFLMSRSALLSTVASSDSSGSWWQVMLFSFLHTGLLISITLSFLPDGAAKNLTPFTQTLFVKDLARFIWIVAPIVAMIMLKGGASEKKKFKYDV